MLTPGRRVCHTLTLTLTLTPTLTLTLTPTPTPTLVLALALTRRRAHAYHLRPQSRVRGAPPHALAPRALAQHALAPHARRRALMSTEASTGRASNAHARARDPPCLCFAGLCALGCAPDGCAAPYL